VSVRRQFERQRDAFPTTASPPGRSAPSRPEPSVDLAAAGHGFGFAADWYAQEVPDLRQMRKTAF
jgi:hypothetical protein